MANRSSKRSKHPDLNQLAASIVAEAIDEAPQAEPQSDKKPHALHSAALVG